MRQKKLRWVVVACVLCSVEKAEAVKENFWKVSFGLS